MQLVFNIERTYDLNQWVVQEQIGDKWVDILGPFETYNEAYEQANEIRDNHVVLNDVPF